MDNILIVVPARGGSTGIPKKNIMDICGRPLIWYTLDYIRLLGLQLQSVVITDCDEIEKCVHNSGINIRVLREPYVASSDENTIRAVYRAIKQTESLYDPFKKIVLLQPTQPIRPLDIIHRCLDALGENNDSSLTVNAPCVPRHLYVKQDTGGIIENLRDWTIRQEADTHSIINGICFAYLRNMFDEEPKCLRDFHANRTYKAIEIDSFPIVDINYIQDIEWFKYLLLNGHTMW